MFYHAEFVNEPTEKYPSSHASSIIELPNGDFLAACFSGSAEKNPDIADVYMRKKAGEDKWSPPEVFHKTPGRSEGNTCFVIDTDGKLWLIFNTMWGKGWTMTKIRYKTSTDNGYTWSEPIWYHKFYGWLIRNRPLILDNGELLVPTYSEFISYKSFVQITADHGKTWKKYGRVGGIKKPCMQPCIVQLADKTLLMYCRTAGGLGKIYQSRSTDRGHHWTDPVPTEFPNPNAGIDLIRSREGDLLVVYNDSTKERTPLNVALSADEGKTWPWKKTLEDTPGEYSYPYIIQAKSGTFHLVHTYHRKKIKHVEFDKEWVQSN